MAFHSRSGQVRSNLASMFSQRTYCWRLLNPILLWIGSTIFFSMRVYIDVINPRWAGPKIQQCNRGQAQDLLKKPFKSAVPLTATYRMTSRYCYSFRDAHGCDFPFSLSLSIQKHFIPSFSPRSNRIIAIRF